MEKQKPRKTQVSLTYVVGNLPDSKVSPYKYATIELIGKRFLFFFFFFSPFN